ncbi:MAG TPA: PIN domain-containing protein [Thermoanaerobaculia bacterium]|nr:PIN domain-containing protein [Thermoanaerobaculia bacterium]
MIIADTGAIVALIDSSDRHHRALHDLFVSAPEQWVLPCAILPEVDYLLAEHVGRKAEELFVEDLSKGAWEIEWGVRNDLVRAQEILERYRSLEVGLVDAIVIAIAERLGAEAIATLDLRDFGAIDIAGSPRLIPRDL